MRRAAALLLLVLAAPAPAQEQEPPPALAGLIARALELGVRGLEQNGALPPMLVVEAGEGRRVRHFRRPDPARAMAEARAALAALPPAVERYALVYEATVPAGERRFDAVVVDAAMRGGGEAWRVAQRYRAGADGVRPVAVGKPLLVGRPPSLLTPPVQ